MPKKILGQAGTSLADLYDVEGSIAGVEQLDSEDVKVVHELGSTILSERLSGAITVLSSGAVGQSLTWDVTLVFPPRFTSRILGIVVITNMSARSDNCQLSVSAAGNDQDFPLWSWSVGDAGDDARNIRIANFSILGGQVELVPGTTARTPSLLIGTEQPIEIAGMRFRGKTSAFGAGTVIHEALIYQAFPSLRGVSSKGLPLPSW